MDTNGIQNPPQSKSTWKVWAVGGAVLGLVAANGFLFSRSSHLEAEISRIKAATQAEIAALRETHSLQTQSTRRTLEALNATLGEAQARAQQAAVLARNNSERAEKKAAQLVRSLAEEQRAQQAQVEQALGMVKAAAEVNSSRVGEVINEVGHVKTEVAQTRSALDATIADLRSVRGDLGVQSGLIATNARELAALKELGERNYIEFDLRKADKVKKVGNIALNLRKADLKRNRFNLEVIADDRKIEKKDRTLNEPVQFYVAGMRQPMELVVNEIHKDRIVGYLATPKLMQARR